MGGTSSEEMELGMTVIELEEGEIFGKIETG